MNNLEETNIKHLILRKKGEARYLRRQEKIAKSNLLVRYKESTVFPQRSIDTWNGLKEEVIMAKNVHQLKEKLDKYRYEDRTTRV